MRAQRLLVTIIVHQLYQMDQKWAWKNSKPSLWARVETVADRCQWQIATGAEGEMAMRVSTVAWSMCGSVLTVTQDSLFPEAERHTSPISPPMDVLGCVDVGLAVGRQVAIYIPALALVTMHSTNSRIVRFPCMWTISRCRTRRRPTV